MWPTPLPAATSPFEVVLINPYELGRQPFGLAEPAALLKHAGFAVACLDLSLQKLDPDVLRNARLVAIHVGMHTATRIAVEALPHIQRLAPHAHLCVYGLYAPMNETLLRLLGVGTVLGGEVELALLSVGQRLRANGTAAAECGTEPAQSEPVVSLGRVPFEVPDRRWSPDPRRSACRAVKCSPRCGSCPTRLRSVRYPRSARTSDLQFRACRSLGTVAPSRPTSSCSPSEGADP
jgi:hypothetical protein